MTCCERVFVAAVMDTISSRPTLPKPKSRAARAASDAYPWPQAALASRQATSTAGVKGLETSEV